MLGSVMPAPFSMSAVPEGIRFATVALKAPLIAACTGSLPDAAAMAVATAVCVPI